MSSYTRKQLSGSDVVFLLEVDYLGQSWFFSSFPIQLQDRSYLGGLDNVAYKEESSILGVDIQANSAAMAVCFDGINIIEQWRRGRSLEGCTAELSYVLWRDSKIQQDYDERVILLSGLIQEPIFGDPLEPVGYVAFSIERKPYDLSEPMISGSQIIDQDTFAKHDRDTASGKLYPIIIGTVGLSRDPVGNLIETYSTPAYNIEKYVSPGTPTVKFLIAGHEVMATTVKIRDQADNVVSLAVQKSTDAQGNVYSYIDATASALVYPGKVVASPARTSKEFWICWSDGGGLRSPYGDGVLEGGGDICRWAISKAKLKIDHGAWQNISSILNKFVFAGYINDSSSCWSWLQSNILPYLPIEVRAGPKGLRPVLAQIYAYSYVSPIVTIIEGSSFAQLSAIRTLQDTSQIVNGYSLEFCKDGLHKAHAMRARISADAQDLDSERKDIYSLSSKNRYGAIEESSKSDYIYDRATAFRICHTQIKIKSFPTRIIEFAAEIEFGFLQLGDVILLTSDALYMQETRSTVIMRSWQGDHWIIGLSIQDNPIDMDRYS